MERYNIAEKLGKGTYGTVFKALDTDTQENVALKTIDLEDEEGIPSTAIREISLLKSLNHPNIVLLKDVVHIFNKLYMVLELMDLDLKHYIDICHNGLQLITIKSLLYQLLQGLAHCHQHQILHRDLKPANLFLNRAGVLKIGDFGLARSIALPVVGLKHEVITLWYRAPELVLGFAEYSTPVDMWSVGCIFAEMLTSLPLFNGPSDEAQIQLIFESCGLPDCRPPADGVDPDMDMQDMTHSKALGRFYSSLSLWETHKAAILEKATPDTYNPANILKKVDCRGDANAADLLQKLLHLDPLQRVGADEALQHPFFQDLKTGARRSRQAQQQQQQQQQSAQY